MRDSQPGAAEQVSRKGSRYWRPPGHADGYPLGNLIYLGTGLLAVNGLESEPALIDPRLAIDKKVRDCRAGGPEWQPSYARCPPPMRASYRLWLQDGRRDPRAPIGHVFLYFYGLERRAVHDARTDPEARAELPAIRAELARLLGIYGRHERFQERAGALVEFLAAQDQAPRSHLKPPAVLVGGLTLTEQVAVAQCAQARAPLSAAWAFRLAAPVLLERLQGVDPPPAERLAAYFAERYTSHCGTGLVLPVSPRRLQLKYWPVSPTFDGTLKWVTVDTPLPAVPEPGDLPAPLQTVVREMAEHLSQHGGRVPELIRQEYDLSGPVSGWPEDYRRFFSTLKGKVMAGQLTMLSLTEFLAVAPTRSFSLDRYEAVCRALAREGVGVHPDPRFGQWILGALVLFADGGAADEPSAHWWRAHLVVHLAGAVLEHESSRQLREPHMLAQLQQALPELTSSERIRLSAYLHLTLRWPPALKSLDEDGMPELTREEREWVGEQLVALLQPHEQTRRGRLVRSLRQIFEMLGLDPEPFVATAAPDVVSAPRYQPKRGYRIPPPPPPREAAPVTLDVHKVAALHREQERLSALLDPVFAEEAAPPVESGAHAGAAHLAAVRQEGAAAGAGLLGLDAVAAGFLGVLVGRPSWTRAELTVLARERGLPLDGILERLNEASYEQLDMPLFEEGDPLALCAEAVAAIAGLAGR